MFGKLVEYSWMNDIHLGNTLGQYLEALVIFIVLFVVFELFQKIVLIRVSKLLRRTKSNVDDVVICTVRAVNPLFYWLISFYFAAHYLTLTDQFTSILDVALMIIVVFQIIFSITKFFDLFSRKKSKSSSVMALTIVLKIGVWVMGSVFVLSNLGIDVTSLVAGLGIGGIAVALAVQNLLEDLFSSFVIYFDKPFQIGDYVTVGEYAGTIEKIGIKTTRLRALVGEEIVISNKELTSSVIQNYRLLKSRRVEFEIGIAYETPKDKLENISTLIADVVEKVEGTTFEWAFIDRFDDSSIVFVVVYNVLSKEYIDYMAANQKIHLAIVDSFRKEEIEMAYPTRVIYNKEA